MATELRLRSFRLLPIVWGDWYGGQLVSRGPTSSTIRVLDFGTSTHWRDIAIQSAGLPDSVQVAGAPIMCRMAGTTVLEIRGGSHEPGYAPPSLASDVVAALSAGRFFPSVIGREITGASLEYPWTEATAPTKGGLQ